MKICVITQRVPYPPNKGEKLRSYHQIEYLVRQGHDVTVYSLVETPQDKNNAQELSADLGVMVATYALPALWRRYLWALTRGQAMSVGAFYSKALFSGLQSQLTAPADSGNAPPDLIYLSASSLVYYIQTLQDRGIQLPPVMLDFMDVDSDKWRQYAESASVPMRWVYLRESRKIKALELYANQHFAATFLIALDEVDVFRRTVSDRAPVTVLGNGMAFDAFYPAEQPAPSEPPVFIFTGVMDYKPNVDAVCWFVEHCWPALLQHNPNCEFWIVGMHPVKQVQELSCTRGVQVTGFVDDILPYFHKATAFIAPFRIARGVQNKVLQAAATGLPVISTPMGAEGIDFANEETMWLARDAEAFSAACIAAVVNQAEARQRAQLALVKLQDSYSWEQKLKPLGEAIKAL